MPMRLTVGRCPLSQSKKDDVAMSHDRAARPTIRGACHATGC